MYLQIKITKVNVNLGEIEDKNVILIKINCFMDLLLIGLWCDFFCDFHRNESLSLLNYIVIFPYNFFNARDKKKVHFFFSEFQRLTVSHVIAAFNDLFGPFL